MAATGPENLVKKHVKTWLKTMTCCWFFSAAAGPWSVGGIPDIIGCINGRFFAIELKAPGKLANATPLQKAVIAMIRGAGGVAFVADDLVTVQKMFAAEGLV